MFVWVIKTLSPTRCSESVVLCYIFVCIYMYIYISLYACWTMTLDRNPLPASSPGAVWCHSPAFHHRGMLFPPHPNPALTKVEMDPLRKVIGESTVQVSALRHKASQSRPPQITEEAATAVDGRTHRSRGTSRSLGSSREIFFQPLMEEHTSIPFDLPALSPPYAIRARTSTACMSFNEHHPKAATHWITYT